MKTDGQILAELERRGITSSVERDLLLRIIKEDLAAEAQQEKYVDNLSHKVVNQLEFQVFCRIKGKSAEESIAENFRRRGIELNRCTPHDFEAGVPDFRYEKDGQQIWVEVKAPNDGLSMNQMKWLSKHPKEKVVVAYVEGLE